MCTSTSRCLWKNCYSKRYEKKTNIIQHQKTNHCSKDLPNCNATWWFRCQLNKQQKSKEKVYILLKKKKSNVTFKVFIIQRLAKYMTNIKMDAWKYLTSFSSLHHRCKPLLYFIIANMNNL